MMVDDLKKISGVGDKLSQKILNEIGGEAELEKIVLNRDLNKIAAIDGVSQRKAVEIVNQLLGNPKEQFLKSERAKQIYEEIISKILEFSNTQYSKNRILLLYPSKDVDLINSNLDFVMKAKEKVKNLPSDDIKRILTHIDLPKEIEPEYDGTTAILVESLEDYEYLSKKKINKYHPILTINDPAIENGELNLYDLILYVYSDGGLDIDGMQNVVMIGIDEPDFNIVPDKVINHYIKNEDVFRKVLELKKILGEDSDLEEVFQILDEIDCFKRVDINLDEIVKSAKNHANDEIENSIKSIDLQGDEILDLLNNDMPDKIAKLFDENIREARSDIKQISGIDFDPFIKKYPLEIDDDELKRVKNSMDSKHELELFDMKLKAVNRFEQLKDKIQEELQFALNFDYEFTLGTFANFYDLKPAIIGDKFSFEGVINLDILKEDKLQYVDYEIYPENVVLLTGANSGGKTTLLETVAQISIMAQMGLPVLAKSAEIRLMDEIYYFSKSRSLDAGAFESFLNTFIPIVTTDTQKLVLLDELEGITELDAAVKIISSFIEMISESDSNAIIVTHMANEIMKYADVRVDGIEAKGLDANYNLIVDRTPKMNYLAKSTPELILKRVHQKADGDLKKVYERILEKF